MPTVDVLIIGAGPAGLSTALHLVKADPAWAERMLLVEKAIHPRHKLCGGAVTRMGLETLESLDFHLPLPLPQARVDDIRLVYASRTIHVPGRPGFVVFHRAEFDAYLADQARQRGARIYQDEEVKSVSVDDRGAIVVTTKDTYRAKAIVGADGAKGVTRRLLNDHRGPARVARLLEVMQPAPPDAELFSERCAGFDFNLVGQDLQGYFWDFPSRVDGQPHFNRGIYDARFAPKRPRADLLDLLNRSLASLDQDPAGVKIEGHPIHWFSPRNRFASRRLLLVGDAAGADPLFGEGIAPALEYGKVAAQVLQQAFERDDFSFRDYRARLLRSPIGRYLLLRWTVAWWGYRLSNKPWYMHGLWSLGKFLAAVWPQPGPMQGWADRRRTARKTGRMGGNNE
ncbi:MAG TPA: NAD(P)/FAD-dependent oxidoreductase [Anaerolineales bacterium]|nr:NAD(P)/FAD-dependent oxidoreductase [Anaerolineales bacterium]